MECRLDAAAEALACGTTGRMTAISQLANVDFWPTPGLRGDRRKLTLAGTTTEPKVSFLARTRTHAAGQERVLPTVRFRHLDPRFASGTRYL